MSSSFWADYGVVSILLSLIAAYGISSAFYFSYLHPLSRYPGPRLAAVSNLWYAYHWYVRVLNVSQTSDLELHLFRCRLSGRYPWAIEDALRTYGPVVRIAPNELVFFTPAAFTDIYAPHHKNLETFVKTDFQDRGQDLGGIIWERDPHRHREVARKLSSAFSSRTVRKMEPLVHKYIDYFVARMKELGSDGVPIARWTNWLAMDLSADMAWNEKMYQMRDMKDSIHLDVLISFNKFATVMQVFKRFPLLRPFQYLFVPITKVRVFSAMEAVTRESILRRIDQRGKTEHEDYFDYILPPDSPVPTDTRELVHIASVSLQTMFAAWGPMADLFYGALVLLLHEPSSYEVLVQEIRGQFKAYDAITPTAVNSLAYLQACLEETLRLLPSNDTGLPRTSPGATVDGQYIPKGTTVQTSIWALARSPRFFHQPLHFRPQRWLPASHPLYDPAFREDHLSSLYPFSLGPRICLGREMAWMQGRLFLAKVLWTFNIEKLDDQYFELEKDLLHYGFFEKPELMVRFVPA